MSDPSPDKTASAITDEMVERGAEARGWHRDGRGIYSLRQQGWDCGKPNLVNDVMIRVERSHRSSTDLEPIIQAILAALPAALAHSDEG